MKKITVIIAVVIATTLSGCLNQALLKSSVAYQESTKPYLKMVLDDKKISKEEKESLRLNISEFEKTLLKFMNKKEWYEF